MNIIFKPYQEKLIIPVKHHLINGGDALIDQPTGSGKTIEMVAISALSIDKFSHIIIAAPQQQIEEGFLSQEERIFQFEAKDMAYPRIVIPPNFIRQVRKNGRDRSITKKIIRYLNDNNPKYTIVCTHASITHLIETSLPNDLNNCLLAIDEAHHVPAEALDRLINVWKDRGGQLLYATATPEHFTGKPVQRDGMRSFRRSLAEHMNEGYAPAEIKDKIVGINVEDEVSDLEFTGDELRLSHTEIVFSNMIYEYEIDGYPKSIWKMPTISTTNELYSMLVKKYPNKCIINAAGTNTKDKENFIIALKNSNNIDIIVGINRVVEGTDWIPCSHIYCVGLPSSATMRRQLLGRTTRYYPNKDFVKITYFILGANVNVLKNLELKHSRQALISCVMMADNNICQEWLIQKSIIKGISSGLVAGSIDNDTAENAKIDVRAAISMEDRANITLIITNAINTAKDNNEDSPTIEKLVKLVIDNNEIIINDNNNIKQVIIEHMASSDNDIGEKVRKAAELKTVKYISGLSIDKAKIKIFDEIVKEFRNETLDGSRSISYIIAQMHKMTGGNSKEFCKRLLGINKNITYAQILEWADNMYKRDGKYPSANDKEVFEDENENWNNINGSFQRRWRGLNNYTSLADFLIKNNRIKDRSSILTEEYVISQINEYRIQNNRWPTNKSGDRTPDGQEDWNAIDRCLSHGWRGLGNDSSLHKLCVEKCDKTEIEWSEELIEKYIREYFDEFDTLPHTATKYEDFNFATADKWLINKESSLSKFKKSLDINQKRKSRGPIYSKDIIIKCVSDFYDQYKKLPTQKSGVIIGRYFGTKQVSWSSIDSWCRFGYHGLKGYTSLYNFIEIELSQYRPKEQKLTPKIGYKICSICKEEKEYNKFAKSELERNKSRCKFCISQYNKYYHSNNT